MMNTTLVFIGGGLGAMARYWLGGIVYKLTGADYPYGTLTVNFIGCFAIGLLMVGFEDRFLVNPSLRIFLTIGILGGFTTFSSFSFETIAMVKGGEFLFAGLNVVASVVLCLVSTYVGTLCGKLI